MFKFNEWGKQFDPTYQYRRTPDRNSTSASGGKVCTEIIHVPAYKRKGKRVSAYDRVCGRRHTYREHAISVGGYDLKSQEQGADEALQDQLQLQGVNEEITLEDNETNSEIILLESVSPSYASPNDTMQIKDALSILGYYSPDPNIGMTPFPDQALFDAIKECQKDLGMLQTGTIMPNSPFLESINAKIHSLLGDSSGMQTLPYALLAVDPKITQALMTGYEKGLNIPDFKNDKELMDAYYTIAQEKTHEGYVTHPYVDTTGNVTYGVGINAGGKEGFEKIEMQVKDGNGGWRKAEITEKRADYDRLIGIYNAEHNTKPEAYQGNFKIDENAAKTAAYEKMQEGLNALRSDDKFGSQFDRLHPEGKLAVLDMIYNMGAGQPQNDNRDPNVPKTGGNGPKGLTYKFWKNFFTAIKKRDFYGAARQSKRKEISHERNKWTHDNLIKGGKVFLDGWSTRI